MWPIWLFARLPITVVCVSLTDLGSSCQVSSIPRILIGIPSFSSSTCSSIAVSMLSRSLSELANLAISCNS